MEWCGENGVPFSIVLTKQDKLKPGGADRNVEVYKTKLLETWEDLPDIYITSADKSIFRDRRFWAFLPFPRWTIVTGKQIGRAHV